MVRKSSNGFYGKHHSDESKRKISQSLKGISRSKKTRRKLSKQKKGSKNPAKKKEVKEKIREGIKKYYQENPQEIKERNKWREGTTLSNSHKNKIKKGMKKYWKIIPDEKKNERNKKISESQKGIDFNTKFSEKESQRLRYNLSKIKNPMRHKKSRKKMAKSRKRQWKKDPQYKKNWINALNSKKMNKKEKIVFQILRCKNKNFIFVGNGKKWFTAEDNSRFNPDFIDYKDKKIVEFFGEYWHKGREERDKKRVDTYIKNGYFPLIVYESELDNQLAENKINNFLNGTK